MSDPLFPAAQAEPRIGWMRRQFLRCGVAAVGGTWLFSAARRDAAASDVRWLADVQRRPKKFPPPDRTLAPLLIDGRGKPIRSIENWQLQQKKLRHDWMKFLGPMPVNRPAVKLKVLRTDRTGTCTRQLVRYESERGIAVEGYLLRPNQRRKGVRRRPGIVALHQTTRNSIDEIAGLTGHSSQHLGLKLAARGFVVFCPRCFLWQNAKSYRQAVADFHRRHPQTLGMHKMLFDAMRGVDVLASLPDVDSRRIGAVGHSLGAKETLYLAAFDERIRAAVASEGGTSFRSTNWDAPWYLGKGIHDPNFKLNHHQLLALIAPRPFLILAGESGRGAADGDRTWPLVEAALPVYRLSGSPARLGLLNHRKGHAIPPAVFEKLAEWLETYLSLKT